MGVEPGFQVLKTSISEPGPEGGELEDFRGYAAGKQLLQPGLEPSGVVLKGQVEDRTPFDPFRAEGDAAGRNRHRSTQSEPALTHLRFARQDGGALGGDPRHNPTRLWELDGHKLRGTHRVLQDPRHPGCLSHDLVHCSAGILSDQQRRFVAGGEEIIYALAPLAGPRLKYNLESSPL